MALTKKTAIIVATLSALVSAATLTTSSFMATQSTASIERDLKASVNNVSMFFNKTPDATIENALTVTNMKVTNKSLETFMSGTSSEEWVIRTQNTTTNQCMEYNSTLTYMQDCEIGSQPAIGTKWLTTKDYVAYQHVDDEATKKAKADAKADEEKKKTEELRKAQEAAEAKVKAEAEEEKRKAAEETQKKEAAAAKAKAEAEAKKAAEDLAMAQEEERKRAEAAEAQRIIDEEANRKQQEQQNNPDPSTPQEPEGPTIQ